MGNAPTSAIEAGVEAIAVALLALAVGYLLVDAAGRLRRIRLDPILCAGLAPIAVLGLTLVIMLAHMATGGAVLSSTLVTALMVGAAIVAAVVVVRVARPGSVGGSPRQLGLLAGLVVLALAVWSGPIFVRLPLFTSGDDAWQLASAAQLMNGATTPSSWFAGPFPNDYPWLFNSVLALFAHFTPGGRPVHAAAAVHVFIVAGSVMVTFALGRELAGRVAGGVGTALFAVVSGGWGFLIAGFAPTLILPRSSEDVQSFLGDFVAKRSYNIAFHNLAPAFPRDLSFLLLGGFLLLLLVGVRRRGLVALVGAGTVLGMVGLTAAESTFAGFTVALITIVLYGGRRRLRMAAAIFGPALAIYALWLAPLLWNQFQHPGFNDLSAEPVVNSPLTIAGAWGLSLLFGVFGAVIALSRMRRDPGVRVAIAFVLTTVALLIAASFASRVLGPGVETLGRSHRYWPLVHLAVVLFAGLGFAEILERVGRLPRAGRSLVLATGLMVIAASSISPVLSSIAFAQKSSSSNLMARAAREENSVLKVLSPEPGGPCVVAAEGRLAGQIASFAGYRFVYGRRPPRWESLFGPGAGENRRMANDLLITGGTDPDRWMTVARTSEVDVVVTTAALQGVSPVLKEFGDQERSGRHIILWLDRDCRLS
ncbi:MAG: hypothetical protein ACRDJT_04990 [Actinomycetota bacterium]